MFSLCFCGDSYCKGPVISTHHKGRLNGTIHLVVYFKIILNNKMELFNDDEMISHFCQERNRKICKLRLGLRFMAEQRSLRRLCPKRKLAVLNLDYKKVIRPNKIYIYLQIQGTRTIKGSQRVALNSTQTQNLFILSKSLRQYEELHHTKILRSSCLGISCWISFAPVFSFIYC